MKIKEAEFILKTWRVKYLIIGFKADGIKCIPINFIEEVVAVESDEELFNMVRIFTIFRVLTIAGEYLSQDEVLRLTRQFYKTEEEKKEKGLLAKLLKKYPQ